MVVRRQHLFANSLWCSHCLVDGHWPGVLNGLTCAKKTPHNFVDAVLYWAHGVVVSHPLRMRKALGSNPSVSILVGASDASEKQKDW